MEWTDIRVGRAPACPVCGTRGTPGTSAAPHHTAM